MIADGHIRSCTCYETKPQEVNGLMRYGCNLRVRNGVYHGSRVSMQHDPRSREHYHRLRSKGHSHGRALRGLADRVLALLCAMLKSGTVYDPLRRQVAQPPPLA